MTLVIFGSDAGEVVLPAEGSTLNDRADGGHLIVNPARSVWDRSALNQNELTSWSFLVAAAGRAMLETLPQLEGGCINYWDAGNWALNDLAAPAGPKNPRQHRALHLHLFGRSPRSQSASWQWGESPFFPRFVDRGDWAASNRSLSPSECAAITERIGPILVGTYGVDPASFYPLAKCALCDYTLTASGRTLHVRPCSESVKKD